MTPRRGLTLVELLISSAIMAMMAAALGTLALAVTNGNSYSRGQSAAAQHARVTLDRIRTTCREAHASERFPGFIVVSATESTWSFPETLVVWKSANPSDADGLPLMSELVIFTPDPSAPNRLVEVTVPGDGREAPGASDEALWQSEIAALLDQPSAEVTQLTDLVRTPQSDSGTRRAAVRFHVALRPSDADWSNYEGGVVAWNALPWAQSIRGTSMGLRQSWCRIELQLMPGESAASLDPDGETAVTFFGSAAIYYVMTNEEP